MNYQIDLNDVISILNQKLADANNQIAVQQAVIISLEKQITELKKEPDAS